MATRSGGVSGTVYALVIFVFLAVLGIALAILFYTQKTAVAEKLAEEQQEFRQVANENQRNNSLYRELRTEEADTVFGLMNERLKQLREWEVGRLQATMEEIRSAREEAGLGPVDASVMEVRELRTALAAARTEADEASETLGQTQEKINSLESDLERVRGEYQKTEQRLQERIDQVQQRLAADKQQLKQEREQLASKLEELREEKQAALREQEAAIRARQTEINALQARIDQLRRQLGEKRPIGPDATLQTDGEIISVNLNENVVTINLGHSDRLILGMTFEVFDRETGVQTEVNREGRTVQTRGKATIEVIRFSDDGQTSTCRVVRRSFGESIQQGDPISNVVYDKDRVFKFFVYGNFDLNNDGSTEPAERRRVEAMIRQWGGELIEQDKLPVDADFLVLGEQIQYPDPLPEDPPPSRDVIRDYRDQIERWKRYNNLAAQARELSIPVLNQNRFLTLVGYYRE